MNKASVQTRPKLKLYAVSQSHRKSTTSNASWEWSTKWQSLYQPGQSQWTTTTTPKERTCGNGIKPYSSHLKESRMNWHLQQPCPLQVVLQSSQAMPLTLDLGLFFYSSKKTVPGSWCTMHLEPSQKLRRGTQLLRKRPWPWHGLVKSLSTTYSEWSLQWKPTTSR